MPIHKFECDKCGVEIEVNSVARDSRKARAVIHAHGWTSTSMSGPDFCPKCSKQLSGQTSKSIFAPHADEMWGAKGKGNAADEDDKEKKK